MRTAQHGEVERGPDGGELPLDVGRAAQHLDALGLEPRGVVLRHLAVGDRQQRDRASEAAEQLGSAATSCSAAVAIGRRHRHVGDQHPRAGERSLASRGSSRAAAAPPAGAATCARSGAWLMTWNRLLPAARRSRPSRPRHALRAPAARTRRACPPRARRSRGRHPRSRRARTARRVRRARGTGSSYEQAGARAVVDVAAVPIARALADSSPRPKFSARAVAPDDRSRLLDPPAVSRYIGTTTPTSSDDRAQSTIASSHPRLRHRVVVEEHQERGACQRRPAVQAPRVAQVLVIDRDDGAADPRDDVLHGRGRRVVDDDQLVRRPSCRRRSRARTRRSDPAASGPGG